MATQVEGLLLEIKAKIDGFEASMDEASKKIEELGEATKKTSKKIEESNKDIKNSFASLEKSIDKASDRLKKYLLTYLSFQGVKDFTTGLFNAAIEMERLEFKMLAAVGSAQEVKSSFEFVRAEADRLGVSFVAAADGFASFSASALQGGMSMREVQRAYTGVLEASTALGLSSDRVGLVFRALEQMASKPNVALEELKLQLGDHLPGVIGIAAQKIGVDVATLMKAISDGSVNSIPFINALGEALSEKFGTTATQAAEGARGAMGRFNTAVFELKNTLAEGKFMTMAANALDGFTSIISSPKNQAALTAMVDTLAVFASLLVKIAEIAAKVAIGLVMIAEKFVELGANVAKATMGLFGYKQAALEAADAQNALNQAIYPNEVFTTTSPNRTPIIGTPKPKGGGGGASSAASNAQAAMEAMQARIDALKMTLASETEQEQLAYEERMKLLQEALEMRAITKAEYDELEIAAAADKAARIAEIEQREIDERMRREQEAQDMINDLRQGAIDKAVNLLGVFGRKNKAFAIAQLAVQKGLAIAEAITAGHAAAAKALMIYGPTPQGFAAANSAILYSRIQAGLIAATGLAEAASMSGGGTGNGGGGGETITNPNASSNQTAAARRNTNVYIDMRGDDDAMLSRNRVRKLLEQINEAMGDGSMLVVAS